MKICILSPVTISDYREFLDIDADEVLPNGMKYAVMSPLVSHFLSRGHDVVICTLDSTIKKSRVYKGKHLTIFVGKSIKYGKIRAVTKFAYEIYQMKKFLKDNLCDIYNAHWSYEFAIAALEVAPQKTIVTLHDWAPAIKETDSSFYRNQRYKMNDWVCKKGTLFTGISPYVKRAFEAWYKKNMILIPNCVDTKYKLDRPKSLNEAEIKILMLNNGFSKRKNAEAGIKAFSLIRKELPNASLYMYGSEYEEGNIADMWARDNNLSEGVFFKGRKSHSEVMKELQTTDLLLHTSLEESMGMTFIEGMITKTLVLGGKNSGAVPWVLEKGKAGLLADINDPTDIAEKALSFLKDGKKWRNQVEYSFHYAIANFSPEKIGDRYLEYYAECVEKKKGNGDDI